MSLEFIGKMGTNLTRLCDSVETFGLVDYQYGVGEAEIMDSKSIITEEFIMIVCLTNEIPVLLACQKLQESIEAGASGGGASSSNANSNVGRAPP